MGASGIVSEVINGGEVVKLALRGEMDHGSLTSAFLQPFEECFQRKQYRIVLDMARIPFPVASFIVLLLEVTARARRAGGDLQLINVSRSARNNLVTFSPIAYLSISQDFEEHTVGKNAPSPPTIEEERVEEKQKKPEHKLRLIKQDELRVGSKSDNLYKICNFVVKLATAAGMEEKEVGKVKIAVYEACLNVIEHAYHSDPHRWINVEVSYDTDRFNIVIHDTGLSFRGYTSKPYDVQEAVENRRTGGFGMHIIGKSMDEVKYQSDPVTGNRLTMVKYLAARVT